MTTPVQHCLITGAYLPIIKRRVNLCSTYIQFQDNYPSEYKRFGIGRDEMMILMPQVMGVDVLSGLDKLKYVGEGDEVKGVSSETMEMKAEKMLKEMDEGDDEGMHSSMREGRRDEAIIDVSREGSPEELPHRMSSRARDEVNINVPRDEQPHHIRTDAREERPNRMITSVREGMRTDAHDAQYSDSDSNDYSDDYYDYDVDIDEDYDTDEEFTDDYDD